MRVTTKIWLGLGSVVVGYLASLCASLYFTTMQERRLSEAATTTLPASSAMQRALAALRLQGRAYQDAVLFGEPDLLRAAADNGAEVAQALAEVIALPDHAAPARAAVADLAARHRAYIASADQVYGSLSSGVEVDPTAAERLAGTFTVLVRDLGAAADAFGAALREEALASVRATATQRSANIAVFTVVISASLLLMVATTISWSRRLNALVGAAEAIADGRYEAAIPGRRDDEIGRLAGSLERMAGAIQERDRRLRDFNDGLQRQVDARTADLVAANAELGGANVQLGRERAALAENVEALRRTQSDLVQAQRLQAEAHQQATAAARQAGMAEIAIGVLHNVGNVLNSVNVASSVASERLAAIRMDRLRQAARMLEQPPFAQALAGDPRGAQLPAYLAKLADAVEGDADAARAELGELERNLEHIRGIIAVQQTYARAGGGMDEPSDLAELVRDAVRMNASGLERHGIVVSEEFAAVPPLLIDKHKAMQVVVNLIANAKDAVGARREAKRIALRIRVPAAGRVAIDVEDNGVGISPEHAERLFRHGFTTKEGGHGFGLHSGSLAAKDLGGSLTAHSDGPGLGSRFTLELPMRPAPGSAA